MDEVLLKRLLGAAILLGVAFGLASLLPDLKPPQSAAVAAYDLSTGRPIEPQAGTMRLPPAETPPAPPGEAPADRKPEPASAAPRTVAPLASRVPPQEPAQAAKPQETAAAPAASWFVQIGSYTSEANARGVLQKLLGLGLPTVINTVSVGKTLWYRVRVGPYDSEAKARKAFARIQKEGYTTSRLVKPDTGTVAKEN